MNTPPNKSIAVLRTGALGDICMSIPLLIALRDHFPKSKISWIIDENMSSLVEDLNGVELIKIKKPRSLQDWRQCQKILSAYKFDVLLMPQSSMRSNLLSLLISAGVKYGFDKLHSKDFQSKFIDKTVISVEEHLVDSFLRFAQAIGVPAAPPKWEITLSQADKSFAEILLHSSDKPIIAICPVSSKKERNWPAQRFAALAKQLEKNWGGQIVLVGGSDDASRAACQMIATQATVIDAGKKTSLKELYALLKRCDLLIAPDTGPVHLANAMGTPVVGLYAVMKASKTGPYHSIQHCVDQYDKAVRTILKKDPALSSWNLRVHSSKAIELIETDQVYRHCSALLKTLGFEEKV